MVAKIVAMRAVNFSVGQFCTEFQCESLRNDGFFPKSLKILAVRVGSVRRFVAVRPFVSVHVSSVCAGSVLVVLVRFMATLLMPKCVAICSCTVGIGPL